MQSYCFIIFKPDALERHLVGPILKDFKEGGFIIELFDLREVTSELILKHYEEVIQKLGEDFKKQVLDYFVGKTMIPVIIAQEGPDAIANARKLVGNTDPSKAGEDTIRGYYGVDSLAAADAEGRIAKNLIHCCDSEGAFKRESRLWFDADVFNPDEMMEG